MGQKINYNDTTPAAPAGKANIKWQADAPSADPTVVRNLSAYIPPATATTPGGVPTPPNDATKFLRGDATFAVPPSATATVAGYVPTPPNDVTKFLAGDGTWKVPAGAGGFANVGPDGHPSSVSAYDDEFEASSLDAKWTVATNVGATVQFNGPLAKGCLRCVLASGSASNKYAFRQTVSMTGDYSVTMKINIANGILNFQSLGFYLADGDYANPDVAASGNTIEVLYSFSSAQRFQIQKWVSNVQTVFQTSPLVQNGLYIHWQRVSGVYRAFQSANGLDWTEYTGFSAMPAFNPTRLGIFFAAYSTSGFYSSVDFIRCNYLFF